MNETYQAKLSGSPPRPQPTADERGDIHIQPHPPHPPHHAQPTPIPVQLPNIYVNPYPHPTEQGDRRPAPASAPATTTHVVHRHGNSVRLGPFKFARPHPLLWLSFALSLIALVLEVPKGSLPTLTGRHKALRTQERLVQERLNLLSRLSTFLPPPLANMLDPNPNHHLVRSPGGAGQPESLDLLKFWNANANANAHTLNIAGQSGGDRWWSVEELGDGASVVKSKGDGSGDREVWVLRVGHDEENGAGPLMNALTHSLLLRDRLLSEVAQLRASHTSLTALSTSTAAALQQVPPYPHEEVEEREHRAERRRREREREKEVEEREREVGRREKWVIEEMRKLTDKVHAEASELTLEDRITERLKAYQRQLSRISEERESEL